jgi:hypothetical protein
MQHRRLRYDRAFESAIREGYLTAEQARQRNNRQAYANALCQRYGLTMSLALKIADNRTQLSDVLRRRAEPPNRSMVSTPGISLSPRRVVWIVPVVAAMLLGLAGLTAYLWHRQVETARQLEQRSMVRAVRRNAAPPPVSAVVTPRVEVERDANDRVTRMTAAKPEQVMDAICDQVAPSGFCATREIAQIIAGFPDIKIGRFTDATDLSKTWTVRLRRDRRSRRWSAGDGQRPLMAAIGSASTRSN